MAHDTRDRDDHHTMSRRHLIAALGAAVGAAALAPRAASAQAPPGA